MNINCAHILTYTHLRQSAFRRATCEGCNITPDYCVLYHLFKAADLLPEQGETNGIRSRNTSKVTSE